MAIPVVVIGAGRRGREWIRSVERHSEFELGAVVETDPAVVQDLGAAIAPARVYSTLGAACDATSLEAVIVATPADRHVEPCATAIERGLAVLVEKPFALTCAEANGLVSLAEEAGTPLLVAQNYRYMRAFRTARRIVQDGVVGDLRMVTASYYRVPHDMAASLARLPDTVLWGMAIHHLDALRSVLGRDVVRVVADSFNSIHGETPAGASLRALLTFDGDLRVSYTATYESSGHQFFEGGQEFYLRVVGERGTLHVLHRWLVLCLNGRLPRLVPRGARTESEESVLLNQLHRSIRHGETADASGKDNLKTMAVVDACRQSSSESRWVDVQERT